MNNAGVYIGESFLDTTVESFTTTLQVNLTAPLIVSQIVARDMIARGVKGAIVNVSSQASMVALRDHTSYCVSKGGLDMLTKVMAVELGPHNIRVNSVNPTVVITPLAQHWLQPEKAAPMIAKIPLGRFAVPEEV